MVIRCTQRLLKAMRVPPRELADAPDSDDDWYANLIWSDRRKCLMLTHAGMLFPVFIADVLAADLRQIGELLERNARTALYDEQLPRDALGDLDGTAPRIARTASRRVLGVMYEYTRMSEYAIASSGGLGHLDVLALNRALRRNLHTAPDGGYSTALDAVELIEKFVFVEKPTAEDAKKGARPTVIFPRVHQWDVVRACASHARVHGPGSSYLIQHSAGSGKSKEIAWLAHDLSTIHDAGQRKVFDKVIVITDRRVLDQQLQAQVKAFEQVRGTVQQIHEDSAQLRAALKGEQARVIITTLQKFPFVLKALTDDDAALKQRSYAVIVDEAHSSQTGESATDLKKVLGARTAEDLGLDEEERDGVPPELLAQLAGRGRQPNLSFFAFTATPKEKTLELFGTTPAGSGGSARAFHTYSMRQAVEEGFILDVLRNYTTYEQLYRLESAAGQIEVPKGKAAARLAQFARFHPYAKDQKAAVIVEHYRTVVRQHLGRQAKAMVVTASREEAVRYKQAIDRYVAKRSYTTCARWSRSPARSRSRTPRRSTSGRATPSPR